MRGRERKDRSERMRPFQKIPLHRVGPRFFGTRCDFILSEEMAEKI